MAAFPSLARRSTWKRTMNVLGAVACACLVPTAGMAQTQDWPSTKITAQEVRRALIWTGHYGAFEDGDPSALVTQAGQAWQKSKGYAITKTLPGDQLEELLGDGQKQRDAVGWATLEDKAIGFSVGVPTRLTKFLGARPVSMAQAYEFEGGVGLMIVVRYGDFNCMTLNKWYKVLLKARPFFHVQRGDWMAFGEDNGDSRSYERAVCRSSGIVISSLNIPNSLLPARANLFAAMGESLTLTRSFNPTAEPHPKLEEPPPVAGDFSTVSSEPAKPKAGPAVNADAAGKTDVIKRATRDGADLSVEQVFQKVSPSVYVVKADKRMGSAVAISEYELLTNCHVVAEAQHVTIAREKKEGAADVISVNSKADRCVLKSDNKLDSWVTVRPYEDIKVGERAVTIGTPQGLELTVAEGIVSSKRTHNDSKLIQTTAPISQGSSGGGLFDAEGHLLGITTFFLRSGQNLNFAVAAEEFAK
jgi:hypothetical protein